MNKTKRLALNSGIPKEVKLSDLLLDDKNPRFAKTAEGYSQDELISKLSKEKNIDELIQSLKENGYYSAEPLLIIPSNRENGKYIVLEGNRRLAALKILTSSALSKKYDYESSFKDLPPNRLDDLTNRVPVREYKKREDLWTYLGYRHIKGAMPWDPYAKALYILDLHEVLGLSLDDIAERIGDKNATIYKIYNGIRVLNQASDNEYINPESSSSFSFSHLYTLLGYDNTKNFLGIKNKAILPKNPIQGTNLKNLKLIIEFLYGDMEGKKKPAIASQNPDIRRLDKVLGDRKALEFLKVNINEPQALHEAFIHTSDEDEALETLITKALNNLKKASGSLHFYKGDKLIFKDVEEIKIVAEDMIDRMKKKLQSKSK